MKRIAWGIVVGGAVAAAFTDSAVANATGETWTPDYDVGNAQLLAQMPALGERGWSPAWELPASFTSGTGTTLTGTDYITQSGGGFTDEFATKDGAIFEQSQLFPGLTNLYYHPAGDGAVVDVMKTPFGNIDLSSAPSWAVSDLTQLGDAATVGQNIVVTDVAFGRIGQAIGLSDKNGDAAAGGLTEHATITTLQTRWCGRRRPPTPWAPVRRRRR